MQPNKHRLIVAAISLGTLFNMSSLSAAAQDSNERIAAALALIEFDGTADPAETRKALGALTQEDIVELCGMLVEPGTGDDTKPRMALHAIALEAVAGVDAAHSRYTAALGDALQSAAPKSVKGFLIRQLQLAGDVSATPHLADLLNDDNLSGAAARALLAIGGGAAVEAMRTALMGLNVGPSVAIIQAVGALRDETWIPTLTDAAGSSNEFTRDAALDALAEIGRREASETLLAAFAEGRESHSWQLRARRTALLLRFAARLREENHNSSSAEIYRVVMDASGAAPHERSAALRGLASAGGVKTVEDIVRGLTSEDAEYRAAAMHVAIDLPGAKATGAYVNLLTDAPPAVAKTILDVLSARGDDSALPAALAALRNADKSVRLAAVRASTSLGGERAVDALIAYVDSDRREEIAAGTNALAEISGDAATKRISRALSQASPRARAALLGVLARRGARGQLDSILVQLGDSHEAVRIAALDATGKLGNNSAAWALLMMLSTVADGRERQALERAVVAICNRTDDLAERAAPVLRSLDTTKADAYGSVLRILGQIGGDGAFAAVRAATGDKRNAVQDAAYRALTTWPQAQAADEILALARAAKEIRHHVFSMRAFSRLVALDSSRSAEESLAMYRAGFEAARRTDERKTLISKIGELKTPTALAALEPFLSDHELAAEAAAAMLTAADGLLPAGWMDARKTIDTVLSGSPSESVRSRAAVLEKRVAQFEDFITDWLTAGPYRKQGKKGNEILDTVFAPERSGAGNVKWKKQPVNDDPARYWFIDMTRVFKGAHKVGYLYTRIYSPEDQPIRLELGSDDGLRVWLNGENIHTNNALRGCERAQDIVKTTLKKGMNELLVKVSNNGGGWAACVRVRAPDGGRLNGVYAKADRNPE